MRGIAARIDPETYEQGPIEMTRYGVIKRGTGKSGNAVFGEFSQSENQFAIERPGGGHHIDPEKALANNRGYVYAAVNAKAREVMNIDFRLFEVDGDDHEEQTTHDALDLLDGVNPDMIGAELKYPTSTHLDLVGNCYWLLTDKNGNPVKTDLDKPDAIYILDHSKTHPLIDTGNFPQCIKGYRMKLGNKNYTFSTSCMIHFRLPDPMNPHMRVEVFLLVRRRFYLGPVRNKGARLNRRASGDDYNESNLDQCNREGIN